MVNGSSKGLEVEIRGRNAVVGVTACGPQFTRGAASGRYYLTTRKSYTPMRDAVPPTCRPLSLTT